VAARELAEYPAQRDAPGAEQHHGVEPEVAISDTTRSSPSPPSAAVTTSVASSPIFRQICGSPLPSSPATYEPGGGETLRDSSTRSTTSSTAGPAPSVETGAASPPSKRV
jgi:hypothetical protein